jgi:hypothetical protein
MVSDKNILDPETRSTLAGRFFKLLCEKNSDAERTGKLNIFTKDDIWQRWDLDDISKENITQSVIRHLRKLEYIVEHADGKVSLTNEGKKHCGEKIILPSVS